MLLKGLRVFIESLGFWGVGVKFVLGFGFSGSRFWGFKALTV